MNRPLPKSDLSPCHRLIQSLPPPVPALAFRYHLSDTMDSELSTSSLTRRQPHTLNRQPNAFMPPQPVHPLAASQLPTRSEPSLSKAPTALGTSIPLVGAGGTAYEAMCKVGQPTIYLNLRPDCVARERSYRRFLLKYSFSRSVVENRKSFRGGWSEHLHLRSRPP